MCRYYAESFKPTRLTIAELSNNPVLKSIKVVTKLPLSSVNLRSKHVLSLLVVSAGRAVKRRSADAGDGMAGQLLIRDGAHTDGSASF